MSRINIKDKFTSKEETALTLTTIGYVMLTIGLSASWIKEVVFPTGDLQLDPTLTTAWIAWTAGLMGWIMGKSGK